MNEKTINRLFEEANLLRKKAASIAMHNWAAPLSGPITAKNLISLAEEKEKEAERLHHE